MGLITIAFALVATVALVVASGAVRQLGQTNQAMLCLLADNLAAERNDQRATMSTLVADQRATRASLSASHATNQEHLLAALARIQGSVSYSVSDAVERTASAIGAAVQTATTPVVAPLSIRDEAERVAHSLVGHGLTPDQYVDPIDDLDPTDRWIAPERVEAAFVAPGDSNPTGVPGLRFDTGAGGATLPFDIPTNPLIPNGAR